MSIYAEISDALDEVFTDVAPSSVSIYNGSGVLVATSVQAFASKKQREKAGVDPHVKFIFRADELQRVNLWDRVLGKSTMGDSYTVVYESLTYRVWSIQDFGKVEGNYVATIIMAFLDFLVPVSVYRFTAATSWTAASLVLNRSITAGIVELSREDSLLYMQRGIEVQAELYCYWSVSLTVDEIPFLTPNYWEIKGTENVKGLDKYKRALLVRRRA